MKKEKGLAYQRSGVDIPREVQMLGKSEPGAISVGNGRFDDLRDFVGNPWAFMTTPTDWSVAPWETLHIVKFKKLHRV